MTLSWDNGAGLIFRRMMSVDTDYMFRISNSVENTGNANVTLLPYGRVYRYGTPHVQGYWILHEGLIGVADQNVSWCGSVLPSILCQLKYKDALKDGKHDFDSTGGWLGFTDKYWAATLIPDQAATFHAEFKGEEKPNETAWYQTDYRLDPLVIAAGATARHQLAALRRRQGGQAPAGLREERQHQAVRSADRLGLVLLHHEADVLPDGGDQLRRAQLRRDDHHPDRARAARVLPARQQAVLIDGEDEEAAAADGADCASATRTTRPVSSKS